MSNLDDVESEMETLEKQKKELEEEVEKQTNKDRRLIVRDLCNALIRRLKNLSHRALTLENLELASELEDKVNII